MDTAEEGGGEAAAPDASDRQGEAERQTGWLLRAAMRVGGVLNPYLTWFVEPDRK